MDIRKNIKLTVIYDNNSTQNNLQADWGFSCLIESDTNKILFDTGDKGNILLKNMKELNIDPFSIDAIFISHADHDHTGGLSDFLKINSNIKIYYPISLHDKLVNMIKNYGAQLFPIKEFTEISPGLFSLGEIGKQRPEQTLVIRSSKGLIIITGCSHPGITNILEITKNKFPDEKIYLVLGGFHLYKSNEEEIKNIVQKIFEMKILTIAPAHCTGNTANRIFNDIFSIDYIEIDAGKIIRVN